VWRQSIASAISEPGEVWAALERGLGLGLDLKQAQAQAHFGGCGWRIRARGANAAKKHSRLALPRPGAGDKALTPLEAYLMSEI